jgi:lactate permease
MHAALPYLVLLAAVLLTRLVPPLRDVLRGIAIDWRLFDSFGGRMEMLYHPGTMLFLGFVGGGLLQGHRAADLFSAMRGAAGRLMLVAAALAAMLGLSRIMVHAGMIETLAEAAAGSGSAWPLLSPFVGVLGTFVTGSATASNILFSEFQQATASALSLPVAALQGAQSFGAAVGNIISPHNVIAGAATVGLAAGKEGEVLRATVLVCLSYVAAGGLATALILAAG